MWYVRRAFKLRHKVVEGQFLVRPAMSTRIPYPECGTLGTGRPWMVHDFANDPGRCRSCTAERWQHADTTPELVAAHCAAYNVPADRMTVGGLVCSGIAPATAAVILHDILGNKLIISSSDNQSRHARLIAGPVMTP